MKINIPQNNPDSTISTILRKDTTSIFNYTFQIEEKKDSDDIKNTKQDSITIQKIKKDSVKKETSNKIDTSRQIIDLNKVNVNSAVLSNNRNQNDSITIDSIPKGLTEQIIPEPLIWEFTFSDSLSFNSFILNIPYSKETELWVDGNLKSNDTNSNVESKHYKSIITRESVLNNSKFIINNSIWSLGIIIFLVLFLTIVKTTFNKFISDSFNSIFNIRQASRAIQENVISNKRLLFFSNFIFVISFSLFIYFIIDYYLLIRKIEINFLFFLIISGIISVVYVLKNAIYKILGFIFKEQVLHSEYTFNINLLNGVLGIILIPIVICIAYLPDNINYLFIYLGLIFYLMFFIIRLIRGMQICFNVNFSILYTFLYLCILEILPFFVIFRFISLI